MSALLLLGSPLLEALGKQGLHWACHFGLECTFQGQRIQQNLLWMFRVWVLLTFVLADKMEGTIEQVTLS